MGRRKSDYICPKCGQKGFKRSNPIAVVHYEHSTRTTKRCYIKRLTDTKDKDHISTEDPPKEFWGESELYHKLGKLANHFRAIASDLEKIKIKVYKFRPDPKISTQCVKYLDTFEMSFLNPVEKILLPHHDDRWGTNWPGWFKIQTDSILHGARAAGIMNAIPTGQTVMKVSDDLESVIITDVVREFTSSQVKRNFPKTLKFANELLNSHPLQRALNNWSKKNIRGRFVDEKDRFRKLP
jgi:hypothetical protein